MLFAYFRPQAIVYMSPCFRGAGLGLACHSPVHCSTHRKRKTEADLHVGFGFYLHTLGPEVKIIVILGALGIYDTQSLALTPAGAFGAAAFWAAAGLFGRTAASSG